MQCHTFEGSIDIRQLLLLTEFGFSLSVAHVAVSAQLRSQHEAVKKMHMLSGKRLLRTELANWSAVKCSKRLCPRGDCCPAT
eukprot:6193164-Pleurochrysis_carterae.AAC.2